MTARPSPYEPDGDNVAMVVGLMADTPENAEFCISIGHNPSEPLPTGDVDGVSRVCEAHGGEIIMSRGMEKTRQKLLATGHEIMDLCLVCATIAEAVSGLPTDVYQVRENGRAYRHTGRDRHDAGNHRPRARRLYHYRRDTGRTGRLVRHRQSGDRTSAVCRVAYVRHA